MYDFTRRRDRDEVAISRELRTSFAEVLAMVCAFGAMAGIVWWWL
jgi:hypothetical protein